MPFEQILCRSLISEEILIYYIIWMQISAISIQHVNADFHVTFSNNFLDPYCRNDETRQPLSRKVPIPSSRINPYRMVIVLRLVVLCIFLRYRITHPVNNAYPLWLLSVICEIWFALSWILDQFPKWSPINRETYLDRLALRWCEVFTANSKLSLLF